MATFNGYKNWNQWNVSLWINNDEGLYRIAKASIRRTHTNADAAYVMKRELDDMGITQTPDGAKYSVTAIRAAMVGM